MDMLMNSMRGISLQCICISNHHIVHVKYLTTLSKAEKNVEREKKEKQ